MRIRNAMRSAVMLNVLATAVIVVAQTLSGVEVADTVFDVPALISTPLNPKILGSSERADIVTEEVQFHSERDGDKDVEIFAYLSYPKGGRALPAFIWNPGGLGQASPAFTEAGARRGYATLCIDFSQPGYRSTGDYPINSGLELGDDPRQAPIYHGAVALLKAVSYLESRPEVDKERIGMAGSSWGGFFTTLMIGIDPRLKVGSCLYGSGNLQLGNAWWDGNSRNGRNATSPEQRERWRTTLDPAWRLPTKQTPIAWFTGTNDQFYLLSGVMQTYAMAAGPKHLMLVPNWDHALPNQFHEQIYAWLDEHLQGKPPIAKVSPVQLKNEDGRLIASWSFQASAVGADLIASYGEADNWRGRYWNTFAATIEGDTCRAELPAARLPCLVSGSITNKEGIQASTPLLRVNSADFGIKATMTVPDYDGCSEWGGFEDPHMAFLERHTQSGQTRWMPQRSRDAKAGIYSAIVEPGATHLPPILSTVAVPHRFRCFLKSEQTVDVTVQLAGQSRQVKTGREWAEVTIDHTSPHSILGEIPASIMVPPGTSVLVDAISNHPLVGLDR